MQKIINYLEIEQKYSKNLIAPNYYSFFKDSNLMFIDFNTNNFELNNVLFKNITTKFQIEFLLEHLIKKEKLEIPQSKPLHVKRDSFNNNILSY